MSKKLTDEQAEQLLRSFVAETQVSDETVNEVADSAQLWWSIQRNIAADNEATVSPWPPSFNWLRFFGFAAPVAAAVIIGIALFVLRPTGSSDIAELQQNDIPNLTLSPDVVPFDPAAPQISLSTPTEVTKSRDVSSIKIRSKSFARRGVVKDTVTTLSSSVVAKGEVRSDFFDLSYAQRPESGQIVRVKVPNSMKVNLGIATSVEKPSELVDAEILVGDDGMTHAIRFISGGQK